jgi:hypothetical protein
MKIRSAILRVVTFRQTDLAKQESAFMQLLVATAPMKDKQANARTGHKPSALVLHLVSYPEWET